MENQGEQQQQKTTLQDRFKACMVLAAVGDILGYRNGKWEFCRSGSKILKKYNEITSNEGMKNLSLDAERWRYSDDTCMHMATAQAFVNKNQKNFNLNQIMTEVGDEYVKCWKDMPGRGAGIQCGDSVSHLKQGGKWDSIEYSNRGGGCGGSMRSACIGLCFKYPQDLDKIVIYALESCRITHHHPTGYLGAVCSSVFTSLALNNVEVTRWPAILLDDVIPIVIKHVEDSKRQVCENLQNMDYFINHWKNYIMLRGLPETTNSPVSGPIFPENYDLKAREDFYTSISWSGWGGASGHDSVIIAYDAFLSSGQDWDELCIRSALHGGDSDSTATIALAWYGALKGFEGVYENNYNNIEAIQRLEKLGSDLYKIYGGEKK